MDKTVHDFWNLSLVPAFFIPNKHQVSSFLFTLVWQSRHGTEVVRQWCLSRYLEMRYTLYLKMRLTLILTFNNTVKFTKTKQTKTTTKKRVPSCLTKPEQCWKEAWVKDWIFSICTKLIRVGHVISSLWGSFSTSVKSRYCSGSLPPSTYNSYVIIWTNFYMGFWLIYYAFTII